MSLGTLLIKNKQLVLKGPVNNLKLSDHLTLKKIPLFEK